jgi:hypothetical protein
MRQDTDYTHLLSDVIYPEGANLLFADLFQPQQTYPRRIETHIDEQGQEHEVWEHTFTMPTRVVPAHERTFDNIPWSPLVKFRRLKRRQRRSTQRKHNKGGRV